MYWLRQLPRLSCFVVEKLSLSHLFVPVSALWSVATGQVPALTISSLLSSRIVALFSQVSSLFSAFRFEYWNVFNNKGSNWPSLFVYFHGMFVCCIFYSNMMLYNGRLELNDSLRFKILILLFLIRFRSIGKIQTLTNWFHKENKTINKFELFLSEQINF